MLAISLELIMDLDPIVLNSAWKQKKKWPYLSQFTI